MTNRTAATRYARALLDVGAREEADLAALERELAGFADLLAGHPALAQALLNPVVPAARKRAVMTALTARARTLPVLAKLLALLAERDRLVLVPDVLAAYRERLLAHRNVVRAEVTTTAVLPADQVSAIEGRLARATGRSVALSARVDPGIIGGVVARVGGTVYDGSVARQLEKIRERLAPRG
jgi:F-type H+-transporting ATPase subunit delta